MLLEQFRVNDGVIFWRPPTHFDQEIVGRVSGQNGLALGQKPFAGVRKAEQEVKHLWIQKLS